MRTEIILPFQRRIKFPNESWRVIHLLGCDSTSSSHSGRWAMCPRVTGYHPISASFVCFLVCCVGGGGETECLTCSLIQMGSSMAYGDNSCPQCGAKCEVWPDIVILSSSCSNYTKEILIKCFNTFDSYCTRNEHHLLLNIVNIIIGRKTAEMNICHYNY